MIVPLHVKSHYSIGIGTASVDELIARAAHLGLEALALTDVRTLAGQPLFHDLCRQLGVKPITGVELPLRIPEVGRTVLLARNAVGYRSLCRTISDCARGVPVPEALDSIGDDVHLLTDSPALIARLAERLAEGRADARPTAALGGAGVYALLSRPNDPERETLLRSAAERFGAPLCADPEIELLESEDDALARLLAAAQANRPVESLQPDTARQQRWFRDPPAMSRLFHDVPDAVAVNEAIAADCTFELRRTSPVDAGAETFGISPSALLATRCNAALAEARAAGRCLEGEYDARLVAEIDVIVGLGYAGYVLTAAEIATFARTAGFPIAPRGSAAGSLVVHLLGISSLDPVRHGLYFERFLNPNRTSPPDIDIDVSSAARPQLIDWIARRFGAAHVAAVGTRIDFQRDSAFRTALPLLGASSTETTRFMDALSRATALGAGTADVARVARTALAARWQRDVPTIQRMIGKPRTFGTHPSGVVIAPIELRDLVPIEPGRRKLAVTQFDMRGIECTGLTKLDLLGNHFLTQLGATHALLGETDASELPPLDDAPTLARIARADTIGCFQIETPALRRALLSQPILRIEDCIDALARVRPGVSGLAPDARWLFDEDLMDALVAAAGISLAEADWLRTAIIDAATDETKLRLQQEFLVRARAHDREPERALGVWTDALQFAAYTFCKAHAWSYGLLAYRSAYLRTHFPAEHACTLLDAYGGAYPLRTIAADLMRGGVGIDPPSVNRSAPANTLTEARRVLLGLDSIAHLSRKTARAIVTVRARDGRFESYSDLEQRVRPSSRERHALVWSGACDELAPLSADAYPFAHEALLEGKLRRQPLLSADNTARYAALVRARNEIALLGMHVTHHPLELLRGEAVHAGCIPIADLARTDRSHVRFVGLLAADHRHRASRRAPVAYLTFEDETGLVDTTLTPRTYGRLAPRITTAGPYLVDGVVRREGTRTSVDISALAPFYERDSRHADRA